jgi:hypothetical protein
MNKPEDGGNHFARNGSQNSDPGSFFTIWPNYLIKTVRGVEIIKCVCTVLPHFEAKVLELGKFSNKCRSTLSGTCLIQIILVPNLDRNWMKVD